MNIENINYNQLESICIYNKYYDNLQNYEYHKEENNLNQEPIDNDNQQNMVCSINNKFIILSSFIDDLYYLFGYCKIFYNFTNQLKILISRFFNKLFLNLYFILPKIKKTKSDLDTNINIKVEKITIKNFYGKLNVNSNHEEFQPLIEKNYNHSFNQLEEIKVISESSNLNNNINININLNFNIGYKKKSSPNLHDEYLNNLVGEFGKIKSDYKSFNQYINSREQIYLTHDKSWGWFIDIESQSILIKKN